MKKNYLLLILFFLGISLQGYSKMGLNHHFKLNGKIQFNSVRDPLNKAGAYGISVRLLLLDKKGGVMLPYSLDTKLLETSAEADGSFSFDFVTIANLQDCKQIAIEISPTCTAGNIVSNEIGYVLKSSYGKVFNNKVINSFDAGSEMHAHTYEIEISNRIGHYIRTLMICREYTMKMLERMGEKTFIPSIAVFFETPHTKGAAGEYKPSIIEGNNKITIEPKFLGLPENSGALYHEYGHYVHNRLVSFKIGNIVEWYQTSQAYIEGFAEFFGMASRSYGAALYGDNNTFQIKSDDHEATGFQANPFSTTPYSPVNVYVPRFAAYLWNIYDGSTQPYIDKAYQGMDNDDVDGYKYGLDVEIFKTIKKLGVGYEVFPDYFHLKFIENLPKDLANSIGKIRSFTIVSGGDKAQPMRQVPIKSVIAGNASYGLMLLNVNLQHYPSNYLALNQPLNDKKQVLHDFKIYKKVNGEWKSFKTYQDIPSNTNKNVVFSLEDAFGGEQIDYKITPYNEAGESIEAATFSYKPMSVSITGPTNIYADQKGKWTANIKVNNGSDTPYYIYRWYSKTEGSNNYVLAATKEDQVGQKQDNTVSLLAPQGKNFHLKVEIEDVGGTKIMSQPIYVKTEEKALKATIKGPVTRYPYELGTWQAEIEGGVPPYKLIWATKIENNYSNIYQGEIYHTKAGENFLVLVGVTDAKGTVVNQQLSVKVLPMEVSIQGDKLAYLHKLAQWQPVLKGGEGPFDVVWSMKKEGENLFWPVDQSYFHATTFAQEGVYYLRVWIKDVHGASAQSEDFKVTALYQPPYIVVNGPKEISVNEKALLTHTLAGGKGPFTYTWKLFDTNNNFIENLGVSEFAIFIPSVGMLGHYLIKLEVKDTYNNKTFYAQHYIKVYNQLGNITLDELAPFVFPNPASTLTEISYEITEPSQILLNVYDSQGNLISQANDYSTRIGKNTFRLDVSGWKADTYLVKFTIISAQSTQSHATRLVVK